MAGATSVEYGTPIVAHAPSTRHTAATMIARTMAESFVCIVASLQERHPVQHLDVGQAERARAEEQHRAEAIGVVVRAIERRLRGRAGFAATGDEPELFQPARIHHVLH